jgi:hypothetical protein
MVAALCLMMTSCRAETVAQAVKRIGRARHTALPAPEVKPTSRAAKRGITLVNGGKHLITVYFHGPDSKMVKVAAGKSAELTLKDGKYQVAVEAKKTKGAAAPLYGVQQYQAKTHYWLKLHSGGPAAGKPSERKQIEQAIDRIKRGPHSSMPAATSRYSNGPVGKGMTLENRTPFDLVFYFKGPALEMAKVPAGKTADIALVVGKYEVAVEAEPKPGIRVQPFYGKHSYEANAHYWLKLWVKEL